MTAEGARRTVVQDEQGRIGLAPGGFHARRTGRHPGCAERAGGRAFAQQTIDIADGT